MSKLIQNEIGHTQYIFPKYIIQSMNSTNCPVDDCILFAQNIFEEVLNFYNLKEENDAPPKYGNDLHFLEISHPFYKNSIFECASKRKSRFGGDR